VWVVDEASRVMPRPVAVGGYGNDAVTVLTGLNGGERIVIAGVQLLTAG